MLPEDHLLSSKDMARFAARGFVRLDEVVPKDICEGIVDEFEHWKGSRVDYDWRPFSGLWPDMALGKAFCLPAVKGAIQSLVGPEPNHDHHAIHMVKANARVGPNLHQDAQYDVRFEHFDIQVSLFAHDVPLEMGGTLFVPGSHFRRAHESVLRRYQHVVGEAPTVCKAGTMVLWHHNLWHSSRNNQTDQDRYMFKVRLNPNVRQERLWNTNDIYDPEVVRILSKPEPWHGVDGRLEVMNRIRFWRCLSGDSSFDITGYLSRLENRPQEVLSLQV